MRHKKLGNGRVVKLKNRRVIAAIFDDGGFVFRFKRLINREEIAVETLALSEEAVNAVIALVSALRIEHPQAGYLRKRNGQEKG